MLSTIFWRVCRLQTYEYICIYICVCMYAAMCIYVCIYIHTHTLFELCYITLERIGGPNHGKYNILESMDAQNLCNLHTFEGMDPHTTVIIVLSRVWTPPNHSTYNTLEYMELLNQSKQKTLDGMNIPTQNTYNTLECMKFSNHSKYSTLESMHHGCYTLWRAWRFQTHG